MLKQVIIVRRDLKMSSGKLAAQVAHASVEAVFQSPKSLVLKWRKEGMKKVVLKVNNLEELLYYKNLFSKNNIVNTLIKDAGKTELESNTITCLGVGPDLESKIDEISSNLKLYK